MKFIDEARIEVHSGKGGNGAVSFRREKFVPRGGPDGGDGGFRGSVLAIADRNINTLVEYRFARIHRARDGEKGRGRQCNGKGADDVVLRMPAGTVIKDAGTGETIADLAEHEQTALLARGGKGGLGNVNFKSSTNRAHARPLPESPENIARSISSSKCLPTSDCLAFPTPENPPLFARSRCPSKVADYPFTHFAPASRSGSCRGGPQLRDRGHPGAHRRRGGGRGAGAPVSQAPRTHPPPLHMSTSRPLKRTPMQLAMRNPLQKSLRNLTRRFIKSPAGWY